MTTNRAEARQDLWRRYDAGDLPADELEVRLQLLDRVAEDDDGALRAAVSGPVPVHRRRRVRTVAIGVAALVAVAGLGGGIAALVGDDGNGGAGGGTSAGGTSGPMTTFGGVAVAVPAPAPLPPPVPEPVCELPAARVDGEAETAANAALLSDPPFVPEGYDVEDEPDVAPGNDADSSLAVAAGDPPPEEVRGRTIEGDLVARVRAFRYADPAAATEAGQRSAESSCSSIEAYEVADRPELYGVVVTGVIPDTAFVSWQLAERRVVVAVAAEGDIDEAKALAEQIAGAELDAARSAPSVPVG